MTSAAVIIVITALAIYFLFFKKSGNLDFWKLVQKHPMESYEYFAANPHWHIGVKPNNKDVVGPFKVQNPATGQFTNLYCDADFIDPTQKELSEQLRRGEP